MLPQSGTSCWYGQQAYTANIRISLTAVLRFVSPQKQRGSRIRVTRVLLNYRRLRPDGQRLRCGKRNPALSNGNTCRPFQHSLNEDVQRLGQRLALPLRNRGLFLEKARGKPCPRRSFRRKTAKSLA